MASTGAVVDTGFLVALFAKNDRHHASAREFLSRSATLELHSTWPVLVEACFFLDAKGRSALLRWLERGAVIMHDMAFADLPAIRETLERYSNLNPDFTDAALVTLTEQLGLSAVITVDCRDFSAYRLKGGRVFNRLWL